jgi:hypothetical protein
VELAVSEVASGFETIVEISDGSAPDADVSTGGGTAIASGEGAASSPGDSANATEGKGSRSDNFKPVLSAQIQPMATTDAIETQNALLLREF